MSEGNIVSEHVSPVLLHPSHRWGKRPIYERDAPGSNRFNVREIPCCMNCLVDGYEDEPDALAPCRRVDNPVGSIRGAEVERWHLHAGCRPHPPGRG